MKHWSSKTYGNEAGLSCTFRQWRADSHCRFLHGYAIGVHFEFGAHELDERNWVYDFGACKWIKKFLEESFDHKTIVAKDDPTIKVFEAMEEAGMIDLRILDAVGCEMFAKFIFEHVAPRIKEDTNSRVELIVVKVFEHQGNSASYSRAQWIGK